MGKATKSDEPKKSKKKVKPARPMTVVKPVLFGATFLALAQVILPKVL
jgi:hypothetical protein